MNQIVYFAFMQSLFLLGMYAFSSKNRKRINGYLIFFVVVLMIGLSGRIIIAMEIFPFNRRFIAFSEFANLMFGPTIYLFTESSLRKRPFRLQALMHYLPAVVYSSLILLIFILPDDEAIGARLQRDGLAVYVFSFIGFALVVNVMYWVASVRMFLRFRSALDQELSYQVKTKFFRNFLAAIGLCLLCWIVIYVISWQGAVTVEINARSFVWTSIALIILFIAYYTIQEPELFAVAEKIQERKYAQSKLSKADLDQLKQKLDQLMEEKRPYLNRNLMKADLAQMLGVNKPEVARLLNEQIGMNFFEYVNYFRIKEFIRLAKTERAKTLTFFGLAQEAGFNSKTTFNKSFKKLMGTSPGQYLAEEAS